MKILGFVPARGGSKGIPGKNLIELGGKPMIQYTLDVLQQLDATVLPFISTEDEGIARYCAGQGFTVTYRRPSALAGDESTVLDAVWDSLIWLDRVEDYRPDAVLVLQPTSPLRTLAEVEEARTRFETQGLKSLVSVTRMREHPYECVELRDGDWQYLRRPVTDLPTRQMYDQGFYFIDGSIYLSTVQFLRQHKALVQQGETELFVSSGYWPVDIDEPDDLLVAEALLGR